MDGVGEHRATARGHAGIIPARESLPGVELQTDDKRVGRESGRGAERGTGNVGEASATGFRYLPALLMPLEPLHAASVEPALTGQANQEMTRAQVPCGKPYHRPPLRAPRCRAPRPCPPSWCRRSG